MSNTNPKYFELCLNKIVLLVVELEFLFNMCYENIQNINKNNTFTSGIINMK